MARRHALFLLPVVLVLGAAPARAATWTELHETAHDIHVKLDDAGLAHVEHAITYRVVAGAMKGFDVAGVERDATVDADVTITGDDGHAYAGHFGVVGEGDAAKLRVDVLEPKGLKKGIYVFHVRYDVDFVKAGAFARDGAMWRLAWTSPPPPEGIDGERVVFDLPAAPTEPRAPDTAVLATLRRSADRDELEIVRPHVARGEAAKWVARVDPKAFANVKTPELRPAPPPPPPPRDHRGDGLRFAGLAAIAGLLGALVHAKARRVAKTCAERDLEARPLVPISAWARAASAAVAFACGVAMELRAMPTAGAALVAVAMAFIVHRSPAGRSAPRGPGSWTMARADDVLRAARSARPSDALDATTRRGLLTILACTAVLSILALFLRRLDGELPFVAMLDAVVLAPVFFSGTRAQLPPDAAHASVPFLGRLFARLRRARGMRVTFWVRVPTGLKDHDESRLLVLPRAAMPGVAGIEVGVAWARAGNGWLGTPEVLVRVHDASPAAMKMAKVAPFARAVPGRRPEERVLALSPALPTRASTRALVARLVDDLLDRRVSINPAWEGEERRVSVELRAADLEAA